MNDEYEQLQRACGTIRLLLLALESTHYAAATDDERARRKQTVVDCVAVGKERLGQLEKAAHAARGR